MFRHYDIRGRFPEEINFALANFLAIEFKKFLVKKKFQEKILIAQDLRPSSQSLAAAIKKVFPSARLLGSAPTPLFYHLVLKEKKPGVIVTASHLDPDFNGFKFFLPSNEIWTYSGQWPKLKSGPDEAEFNFNQKNVAESNPNVYKRYLDDLKKFFNFKRKHQFNFDRSNQSANVFLFQLLPKVFPRVKIKPRAKIFVRSDFDGDRLEIWFDQKKLLTETILSLFLRDQNYEKIGLPIVLSERLKEIFPNKKFYLIRTGHSSFKAAFNRYRLDLAIEPSGHFYFFKEIQTEAPLMALLKLFALEESEDLDELIKGFHFQIDRFTLNFDQSQFRFLIKDLTKSFCFKIKRFDGVELKNDFGRVHLRFSQTEKNRLRVLVEGKESGRIKKFIQIWLKKNS
ncbi:MAG: hypothetical protein M1505_00030 [Patescibacteria group bacterium]|nr:hypothetical protein [Patescibacteria group bacterium]